MAKKRKKKNNFKGLIIGLLFIFILALVGYLGYRSYVEIQGIVSDIENFEYNIPDDLSSNITFPTKIGDKITIEWDSSNKEYLSNSGEVTFPDFEEGDQQVTLTGKIIIDFQEILTPYILEILGIEIEEIKEEVTIPSKLASDEDKVESVIERLSLIDETYSSINLPSKLCYESITITWNSSNKAVMSNDGVVYTPSTNTDIILTAEVKSNDYIDVKEFKIKVLAQEKLIEVIDDNFDNQAQTSKYTTFTSTSGVTYNNARILEVEGASASDDELNATVPSFVRLRNKDENNGSFILNDIDNINSFSFKYKFSGSQKTENSILKITVSSLNEELQVIEIPVKHINEFTLYNVSLSKYYGKKLNIKVEHIDEWSGETFIDIDDVNVKTNVSIDDLEQWLLNNAQTNVSKSIILPFVTIYGGSITWESSNPQILSKEGIVNKQETSQTVTLTATIKYLDQTKKITIDVVVIGLGAVEELEIFFIDIGKYGAGDCGESTYIKLGDIDIIVDAGDNFESTVKAISETINQNMEDGVIEYVIATHPDGDHIGGMKALFDQYTIESLIKFEGNYTSQKYKNFETAYINEGCDVYQIKSDIIDKNKGDKFISLSSDVFISFIDTTYYSSSESNGKSIVFVLEAYGTRVLMTGDADNASGHTDLEQKYMKAVGDIDILKVVHHGTSNGTTSEFLNIVDPEVAIICNGNYLGNKHGHPHPTAIKNLYSYDESIKVYCITGGGTIDGVANKTNNTYKCSSEDRFNQRNGLITLIIDNTGYKFNSEYYGSNLMELKNTQYYSGILQNNLG